MLSSLREGGRGRMERREREREGEKVEHDRKFTDNSVLKNPPSGVLDVLSLIACLSSSFWS